MTSQAVDVYCSYASQDAPHMDRLKAHLAILERQGLIRTSHVGGIAAGEPVSEAIRARINRARVILLLVSPDFIASDDTYDVEMRLALQRRMAGTVLVIPVLVRPCDWGGAAFAELRALPSNGTPVASWPDQDEAWTCVAQGIRRAIEELDEPSPPFPSDPAVPSYGDEATRVLSMTLEEARERLASLVAAHAEPAVLDVVRQEIVALRRELRVGGQLRAGDSLADGRYLLLRELGRGGFGVVWRAKDRRAERDVAVKVLHTQYAAVSGRLERFERGARVMAQLDHPAVVRVLEMVGLDDGFHYFVMELLTGGDLRRAILDRKVSSEETLEVVLKVGDALTAAHAEGYVHRDVKPTNILLDEDGSPKLTDFDLVWGSETTGGTQDAMGTFPYAAPEQMGSPSDVDARADVYGLAMTAIFALLGRDLTTVDARETRGLVEGLSCGQRVKDVLERAVAWDTLRRHKDAGAFCADLREACLGPASEAARPQGNQDPVEPTAMNAPPADQGPAESDQRRVASLSNITPLRRVVAGSGALLGACLAVIAVLWGGESPESEESHGATVNATGGGPIIVAFKSCPPDMVMIPGGTFLMGEPDAEVDAGPPREVTLTPFCLDRTEVTVAAYARCVGEPHADAKCSTPDAGQWCNWGELSQKPTHPINCVDFEQARAYCRWVGEPVRLPTEAEWEYAARGQDGRIYPWGNEEPEAKRLNACGAECTGAWPSLPAMYVGDDEWPTTAPAGSYPSGASPFGLLDMAGNVWEWTADWFAPYDPDARIDPRQDEPTASDASRVVRGGAWRSNDPHYVRAVARSSRPPSNRFSGVGFRCARTAK